MKKYLFEIIIVFFIIIEIILIAFNFIDKYEIAKILKIYNINDFSIQELRGPSGYSSSKVIYIKFKISFYNYEKYNLTYQDVQSEDGIYEGEITNKKLTISDNYYMCYYESVIYDENEKDKFRKIKNDRIFLKISSVVLIFLIFVYGIKKIKNRISIKSN